MYEHACQYINLCGRRETRSLNIKDVFKVGFSRSNVLVTFLGMLLPRLHLCLGILLAMSFQPLRFFDLNAFCELSSTLFLHRGFIKATEGSVSGILTLIMSTEKFSV